MVSSNSLLAVVFKIINGAHRVHTFKIRVYPPAILPMLAVYGTSPQSLSASTGTVSFVSLFLSVSVAMEAIGDITASAEVSRVAVDGEEFDSRIQGGVLVRSLRHACYPFPPMIGVLTNILSFF